MKLAEIILFIVKLLAGTGVFLVGVHLLTSNIEQLATGKIKSIFGKTAEKRLTNVAIGAATTALIQSSGVTTVLIVGFVNVGIISLYQATAMIMGANIGTTVTAQIAALSAFPITTYIQIFTFVGVILSMICKSEKIKRTGSVLSGLGLIFIGLSLMSTVMKDSYDLIQVLFQNITNPFLLLMIGVVLTALVQSSSATTSIIISMSVAGLTIGTGGNEMLYIILGTNIGSCVTALMSSFTAGANAKRTSLIHLLFNTFGSVIFFVILILWPDFMSMTFRRWFGSAAIQIAMFHTFFNVICTLVFLPFSRTFVKISETLIKEKRSEKAIVRLDERMLSSSSIALSQLEQETVRLADEAMEAFRLGYRSFDTADRQLIDSVYTQIEKTDERHQAIVYYIVRLSARSNQLLDEKRITNIHSNVSDIMRIAEIADNFTKYTRSELKHNLNFSQEVKNDIRDMVQKIEDLYALTKQVLLEKDSSLLPQADEVESEIDAYRKRLIDGHIARLNAGTCQPESSGVFINLVSNLERLGDHLTYIAHTVA